MLDRGQTYHPPGVLLVESISPIFEIKFFDESNDVRYSSDAVKRKKGNGLFIDLLL
jgi:hypothetical protein